MTRPIVRSIVLSVLAAVAACAQLTVSCAPAALPSVVGETVSVTCSAPTEGTPPYTWTVTPADQFPPGLSQDPNTGDITGTLADPAGTYNFTVVATDSTPGTPLTGTQAYSVTTTDFTVTCTLTTGPVEVGVPYANSCTAAGGTPPYNWTIAGTGVPPLMAGSITPTGDPATIAYTPASSVASYQYRVVAADSSTPSLTAKTAPFTGAIAPPPLITTTSPLPQATVGVNYSESLMATGGVGTYTWAVSTGSSLPSPLVLNSGTGVISGLPTTAGPASFTIQVTDSNLVTGAQAFALTINPALVITTTSPLPQGTVGVNYLQTLAATGGSGTYTWTVTVGSLPSPLVLNSATGAITGLPATAGTSNFSIQATDTNGVSATLPVALTINPALAITTASPLPGGAVGANYSQTLAASGGSGTYTWAVTVGSLPSPLVLNSATGQITASPPRLPRRTSPSRLQTATRSPPPSHLALTIDPALMITTTSPLPTGTVGVMYSKRLAASWRQRDLHMGGKLRDHCLARSRWMQPPA